MNFFETLAYYLQYSSIRFALIAGALTALCASLIGVPLVLKRYSFIGDGLSHTAFGAMAVATVINLTNNLYLIMPLTVLISVLLLCRGNNAKLKGDAAIAMLSVGALAFGYFLLNVFPSSKPGAGNIAADVCTSLFGSFSILTLDITDIWICIGMTGLVLAVYLLFYNKIFAVTFDSEFMQATGGRAKLYEIMLAALIGVVVSLSMQLVGSLLTSALIIFPALSAMRLFKSFKAVVLCAGVLGVICAVVGLLASVLWETPVGATIGIADIVVFAAFYLIGILVRRKQP